MKGSEGKERLEVKCGRINLGPLFERFIMDLGMLHVFELVKSS